MIKQLFYFILFFHASLMSNEGWDLYAKHVSYEKGLLSLSEAVSITSAIGNISANKAFTWANKKVPYELFLQGDVTLETVSHGKLTCYQLYLFPTELKGKAHYSKSQRVRFKKEDWDISSNEVSFSFQKTGDHNYLLNYLEGRGHVTTSLKDKGVVQSDSVYLSTVPFSDIDTYILTFFPKDLRSKCRFSRDNGDHFSSNKIQVFQKTHQVHLTEATGEIWLGKTSSPFALNFSAQSVIWDDSNKELTLERAPKLIGEGISIFSKNKMVAKGISSRFNNLDQVFIEGPLEIIYYEQNGETHSLQTEGNVLLDPLSNEIFISSLETPLKYIHPKGVIFSKEATLFYDLKGNKVVVNKVYLHESVELIIRENNSAPVLHHVLADTMEIYPQENKVDLWSHPNKTLTLYDFSRGIKMDARHIEGNLLKEEVSFRGLGRVELTLLPEKKELL
jgi:hypothetical protein